MAYFPRRVSDTFCLDFEDFCNFLSEFIASFNVEDIISFSFSRNLFKSNKYKGISQMIKGKENRKKNTEVRREKIKIKKSEFRRQEIRIKNEKL